MIHALISDLGNVLLHFDHRIIAARLKHDFPEAQWTPEQEQSFWTLVRNFESGVVDTEVFLRETGTLLGSDGPLDVDHFRILWGDIFWLNDEYLSLMQELRDSLKLVMLSNTNPLHIDFARERFPEVFEAFPDTVYSYEIGSGKPDPVIYRAALERAAVTPDETLYFDDISAYVEAANSLGMHGHQYVSVQGVRDVLQMYDVPVTLPE